MIMLLSLQEDALLEGNFGFHNRFGKVMNVQTNWKIEYVSTQA